MPGARRALIAAAAAGLGLFACGPAPAAPAPAPATAILAPPLAVPLGIHVWREPGPDFGGYSGLELSPAGDRYWALSDRGTIRWGSIDRDSQGRISRLTTAGTARLQDSKGAKLKPGYLGDAEGLAIDGEGRIFVSFEGLDRIVRYDDPDGPAVPLPAPRIFEALRPNAGLEALAITASGDLLTIPESWPADDRGIPVWRLRKGRWTTPFFLPRDDRWAPVGADVGPDGMLYVLERDFRGLAGFASRVRRYAMTDDALGPPELLVQSLPMQFDNLEGIAVWQDGRGIRLTLISDDNFLFLQKTELVEFRVLSDPVPRPMPPATLAAPIPADAPHP